MNEIVWPEAYLPGTTDFYVSNETIVSGLNAAQVWPFLVDTAHWSTCCPELSVIQFHDNNDPGLRLGSRIQFFFGSSLVQAEIQACVAPTDDEPGRLAWHGWVERDGQSILDAHCGWLIEDLPHGRVRILWQESLLGSFARELARLKPNPVLSSHQQWVDGIAAAALAVHP